MKCIDKIFMRKTIDSGNLLDEEVWRTSEEGKHFKIESETGEIKAGFGGKLNGEKVKSNAEKSEKPLTGSRTSNPAPAQKRGGSRAAVPAKNKRIASKDFVPILDKAKGTCPPDKAWRVDTYRKPEDFDAENIKTYTTDGGSTFAIKPDGDIISVCKNQKTDAGTNARDLMAAAVEAGGTHLDSYAGNYEFYTRCGFEPVSRCRFDEKFAPPGWTKGRDDPEDIYFMRYVGVGKVNHMTREDGEKSIPYSKDYDAAAKVLEDVMKGE